MHRGGWIFILCATAACAEEAPIQIKMPGILRQALTGVSELEATAELIAAGGARQPAVMLKRNDDGVTFTGFIPAEPGEYSLELAFSGIFAGYPSRLFLGRWTSDVFTVTRGNAAQAGFSRAIDPLGRPGDGGDLDGDGSANLQEILARTDPGLPDTDADGVEDGADCDPTTSAKSTRIAAGGSVLDCDADGYVRRDPPYGTRGDDCDDGAADTHPGAVDACDDNLDRDCDPTTCPVDDMSPPVISEFRPAGSTAIGCQARISALVEDDSQVSSALLAFPDDPYPGPLERLLLMYADADDRWQSAAIQDASGIEPLSEGPHRVQLRAYDAQSNIGYGEHTITLAYGVPRVTSMTPERFPPSTGNVAVQISSTVVHGTPRVRLYAASRAADGFFHGSDAVIVAEGTGSPANLTIDTTRLENGEYLLFPVIADDIGNELSPLFNSILGINMTGYYPCILGTQEPIPTRVLMVGNTEFTSATMAELLPRAITAAAAVDPGAGLVQVIALGIDPNGQVQLDSTTRYTPRWEFMFYNPVAQKHLSVGWLSFAYGSANPVIDPDAGSTSNTAMLADPNAMIDSDRAVQLFAAQPTCPGVTGADEDVIQYFHDEDSNRDVIMVGAMGEFWRGSAAEPGTTIFPCN